MAWSHTSAPERYADPLVPASSGPCDFEVELSGLGGESTCWDDFKIYVSEDAGGGYVITDISVRRWHGRTFDWHPADEAWEHLKECAEIREYFSTTHGQCVLWDEQEAQS